jgi:ribosome-associated translation inhibitor RaiA
MAHDSNFLKNTLDLLEADPEVKSYIYQQITDFNPFVTPETLVMVIARDPQTPDDNEDSDEFSEDDSFIEVLTEKDSSEDLTQYKYRIAIVLKEADSSIEAEAYHDDIFEAIRLAKEALIERLLAIQEEVESPQDRMKAIKEASDNKIVH